MKRRAQIAKQVEALLKDNKEFGVKNIEQYSIASYWAKEKATTLGEEKSREWLAGIKEKGAAQSDTSEKRFLEGVLTGIAKQETYNRTILAKAGAAMEVVKNGPCTLHALAAVDKILRAQEDGSFPFKGPIRIISGKHEGIPGETMDEAHVLVVLDSPDAADDPDYLKSDKVREDAIVIDTWYAAQGGTTCMTAQEFTDSVGNYLELGERTKVHFIQEPRSAKQLKADRRDSENTVSALKNLTASTAASMKSSSEGRDLPHT